MEFAPSFPQTIEVKVKPRPVASVSKDAGIHNGAIALELHRYSRH
ncbi:predicted protein [Sclerotinia sclerotiorum 1980 UF-70]|uniref:Uncharacterized protein n=1 Tax=Sclerotinia sclerotiorum (strain ATCC 18683 / 1980 / Ss-1) TaxID=665079 RepID=A7EUR1_SCLS1|nr:predicted protein [Sclerotinia sclerotiorum 1980 UF-70]EDN93203.1 predicted protein [Sclerotinia sclerotiorum 1980 UF-70]